MENSFKILIKLLNWRVDLSPNFLFLDYLKVFYWSYEIVRESLKRIAVLRLAFLSLFFWTEDFILLHAKALENRVFYLEILE